MPSGPGSVGEPRDPHVSLRVSVVTAVLNRAATLPACLASVGEQTHPDVEHVLVDGGSTDGSVELIRNKPRPGAWVSEPDGGLYEAVNKGIGLATGDVIGVLGADDVYEDATVLARVAERFADPAVDAVYGDLRYVAGDPPRVVRTWVSGPYVPGAFRRGWMPPHPTFFARRELFARYGRHDTRLRIAADYELMLRFVERHGVRLTYLPAFLVRMRLGGVSNAPRNLVRKTREDLLAWRLNGLLGGRRAVLLKNLRKLPQLLGRATA